MTRRDFFGVLGAIAAGTVSGILAFLPGRRSETTLEKFVAAGRVQRYPGALKALEKTPPQNSAWGG